MKQELIKSCPFCGSKKIEVSRTNPDACWITCGNDHCTAQSKSHPSRAGAIRNWNRRSKTTTTATKITFDMDAEHEARKLKYGATNA